MRDDVRWGDLSKPRMSDDTFDDRTAAIVSPLILGGWVALCYAAVWLGLVLSQPEAYAPAWARRIRARRAARMVSRGQLPQSAA